MSITKRVDKLTEFLGGRVVKNSPAMQDTREIPGSGRSPGEGNGNLLQHSCLRHPTDRGAWQLQSMGSQRVGHDWATNTSTSTLKALYEISGTITKDTIPKRSKYWMYLSIYETITACKTGFQEQRSASSMPNSKPVHCALSGDGGILLHP